MKTIQKTTVRLSYLVFVVLSLLSLISPLYAQHAAKIQGNGQVTSRMELLQPFSTLKLNGSGATVEVYCGKMPKIEITTDTNIQSNVKATVQDNTLTIQSEGWIEPTKLLIRIQTPFMTRLETDGWSRVTVQDINSQNFYAVGDVGTISLAGQVEELNLNLKTTQVDARQLQVKQLVVNMSGRGRVVYGGNPTRKIKADEGQVVSANEYAKKNQETLSNIALTMRNNRLQPARLVVMGPDGNPFSYGFEIGPFSRRFEQWPVGTKVFQRNKEGNRGMLLLQVRPENAGKVVSLF